MDDYQEAECEICGRSEELRPTICTSNGIICTECQNRFSSGEIEEILENPESINKYL